jgi:DNA-binding MarR family transcriptional regulator
MAAKHDALVKRDGLNRVRMAVMFQLAGRSPRRLTDLAEALGVDLSVLSRQVAELEAAGAVARRRDPDDGRAWLVDLTDHGRGTIQAVQQERRRRFAQVVAGFPDEQLAAAAAIVQAISAHLDAERDRGKRPHQEDHP